MYKTLLELINEVSKVPTYKINLQKQITFLFPNNEKTEKETEKTAPFTTLSQRITYSGINLTKKANMKTINSAERN
jgi:hypothetical protein